VPEENCTSCNANNDALELIDSDGDGICDALENPGCLSETACNYNLEASSDDGSCLEPIENCSICNGENNELILIDTDDDGICDAEEIIGCQNESACNYNPEATDEADCIEPVENCSECNEDNTDLLAIDTDDDGICDADEVLGCASETACNYNVLATDDDESCIEPEEDCFECNENNDGLIIIDADGDGVCDENEVEGCMYEFACNYNSEATDDNGSCELESCSGCTYTDAVNFDASAQYDNGQCIFNTGSTCPGDFDLDGDVSVDDLMFFLSLYGNICNE